MLAERNELNEKQIETGELWKAYPPTAQDRDRVKKHDELQKLYDGEFCGILDRFDKIKEDKSTNPQIKVNFFQTVSNEFAKLLFGEEPEIKVPEQHQDALNVIFEASEISNLLYQTALTASAQGGAVLKAWRDETSARISFVKDSIYFPTFDSDDETKITGVTLAWIRQDFSVEVKKQYVVREMYRPGEWKRDVIDMQSWTIAEDKMQDWYPDYPTEWTPTGYDGIPVEYIPNFRVNGAFWGESDYKHIKDLIETIMCRLSRTDGTLNRHSDPDKILPNELLQQVREATREELARRDGFLREDCDIRTGRSKDEISSNVDVYGVDAESDKGNLPRYLTWDASLASAYQELDKAFEMLLILTCLPPEVFGLAKYGVSESGRALKFRNTRALAETNKKRLFMIPVLKRIIRAALALEGADVALSDISIVTEDGLPFDQAEITDIAVKQVAAGIASLDTAISLINPDLTDSAREEEIERIKSASLETIASDEYEPRYPARAVGNDEEVE